MAGAGRTGHGVRAGSVTLSPQGLLAGSTMRLCAAGAALFAVGHVRGGRQRPSLPCGLRAPSNGTPPGRRYEPGERRSDYGCPLRLRPGPSPFARTLARRLALPLLFVARRGLPLPAVAGPRDADRLQRRAPLREALAVDRRRARTLDPRRAVLLPRAARAARSVAGLAPELDDRRVHRGEDPQRGRDVRRGLPGVLACAPRRPAVVRLAHRRRGRGDAGDVLPRATSCPRRSRIRSSCSTVAVLAQALADRSSRMAIAVPAVMRSSRSRRESSSSILPLAYLAAVALCGRGNYRRHALSRSTRRAARRRAPRASRRARQYGERDAPASVARRRSRTGRS